MGPLQTLRFLRQVSGTAPVDTASIERMGLLAVKLGQLMALRSDFLPPGRCQELQKLFQSATQIPPQNAQKLLEQNAPGKLLRAIVSFDPAPVAAASVGQVHRARLRSGELVAIKLLKDDFLSSFRRDVRWLKFQMKLARTLYPPLRRLGDVTGLINHLESYTLSELDLRNEITGARRLRALKQRMEIDLGMTNWRFPRYYEDLSNEKVLVSEWCEGPSLETLLSRGELEVDHLLELFRIHGTCMFAYGEFHGDLHPGNVIVQEGQFVFLDNAAVVLAPSHVRSGLLRFFHNLAEGENDSAFEALLAMAPVPPPPPARHRYMAEMRDLYRDFRRQPVSAVSMSWQMMQTIRKAVEAGCVFAEAAFPIIRSLMYMDGMVLRAAPQTDIIGAMKSALAEISEVECNRQSGNARQVQMAA